ncbi:YfhO family protein [Clostridium sp. AN503]|uniref:YfhO family protein n=1 Tax=Clostridium sp. AN503 TaxID=3160598 RepID=UPI003458F4E6
MYNGEITRITKELEDLLMTEEIKDKETKAQDDPVEGLLAEMESAVTDIEGQAVRSEDTLLRGDDAERSRTGLLPDAAKDAAEPLTDAEPCENDRGEEIPGRKNPARRIRQAKMHGWPGAKVFRGRTDGRGSRFSGWSLVRPYDGLAAAFIVPVIIMLIIFAQRGIFPFGEESFLRTDMYHQYAPFFSEFQNKLTHGGSLLYSWDVGMGVNFSALYAYYLASPLNWLLVLCPKNLVIEFMTYMIVLKIGLSGLSMAYYLRRHCKTCDFGIAFFGIFYALSGYMAAYSWNIMWLDCIILFPLIVLGLERLVKDGKGMLYCLALGMSILSNYYISIMTCIFMVMYFIALLILDGRMTWEKFVGRSFQFALYSLLAGGLAAVVLIPEIYALQMTASADSTFPKTFTQYFPIFDMIARHIGNVETEIGLDHWPNIYCGVAVLMFFPLYLANRKISAKEKAVYCILLLFFMASFSFNVMNFLWHGFHFPNSLPCRQSYIYIFLVLLVCYRAYMHLRETPWHHVTLSFAAAVVFVLLAQKLVTEEHFHFIVFYVAILFLALYLAAIALYRKGPKFANGAVLFALAVVSIESAVNTTVTSVTTTSRTAYTADNEAVERLVGSLLPNETFYRVEKVTRKTKNDGAWMHFPSVSLFSSTANADLSKLFKRLGCESSTNAYSITGSTPLIDALFAVKYALFSEEPDPSGIREFLAQEEEILLYQNKYALPLGFFVAPDFEERWDLETGNPADVQNSLTDSLETEHVMSMVLDARADGKKLTFYPEVSGEYYAYVGNKKIEKVTVNTWKGTKTWNNVDRGYLLELGYCTAGEEVSLTAENTEESMWADVYRFSEEGLAAVYDKLSETPWKLSNWTGDTYLKGTIACQENGMMMTTIPYDKGWKILVDGVEQPAAKMLDSFIGVRLTPGSHTVEMSYRPEGLNLGWMISAGSTVMLLFIALGGRYWRKYRGEIQDSEMETRGL